MKRYELPSPRVMTAGRLLQEKVSLCPSDLHEGWREDDERQLTSIYLFF